jgi:hypothetical protein
MTITNKLSLPDALVKAVSTEKHNSPGCLSATTLLQGTKQIILTDRHWDELEDDVAGRIWALWGTTAHRLLEQEGEHDFTEQEMSYKAGNVTVTGRIDNYNMKTGTVWDYKTASVNKVKFNDFSDWYVQGMIYAWLLTRNNFPVERCCFIALLKDHSKTEAERNRQYPQSPVYVYGFPVTRTGLFKTGGFIREKISAYEHYREQPDDAIPPCSPDERWERAAAFAVKKEGRKTAVKLFDNRDGAEKLAASLGKGHFVEHRTGESIKCRHYCLCRAFCNFYREQVPHSVPADVAGDGKKETGKAAA